MGTGVCASTTAMGTGVYASTTEGQLTTARKHGVGDGWEPKAPKLHPCGAGETLTMGLPDTFFPLLMGSVRARALAWHRFGSEPVFAGSGAFEVFTEPGFAGGCVFVKPGFAGGGVFVKPGFAGGGVSVIFVEVAGGGPL